MIKIVLLCSKRDYFNIRLHSNLQFGLFLENDFWTPPSPTPLFINFEHGSYMLDIDIIDHVAAALGPESVLTNLTRGRSARPRNCFNLT